MPPSLRLALAILLLTLLGCPGKDSADDTAGDTAEICTDGYQLYVGPESQDECASECPEGSFEAYTDGDLLVCDACREDEDCDDGMVCSTSCGPGCENDTSGGCCPVNYCVETAG